MPFKPPEPPKPPTLDTPRIPPLVGSESPWVPASGENRDRVIDWWRAWWRRVFFPWLKAFLAWLQKWLDSAAEYISEHATAGAGFYGTHAPLPNGFVGDVVVWYEGDNPDLQPKVGDSVISSSDGGVGTITALMGGDKYQVAQYGNIRGAKGEQGVPGVARRAQWLIPYNVAAGGNAEIFSVDGISATTWLWYRLEMSVPDVWVRIYDNYAHAYADRLRAPDVAIDAKEDHGCYLDFISHQSELVKTLTPSIGVSVPDGSDEFWVSVRHLKGSAVTHDKIILDGLMISSVMVD